MIRADRRPRDPEMREKLRRSVTILMPEYRVPENALDELEERTRDLMQAHRDQEDCRIVAEAEVLKASWLVTFDRS